jgi:hypothetical protein
MQAWAVRELHRIKAYVSMESRGTPHGGFNHDPHTVTLFRCQGPCRAGSGGGGAG